MTPRSARLLRVTAAVAAFAAIAALYRVALETVPPYLAHDEVQLALNAQSVAASGRGMDGEWFPIFFSDRALGEYGREPVSIYGTALVLKFLRDDEFAIRLASVIVGLVNVILMALVARRYFGSWPIGASAAALFAFTPIHFFLSRVGIEVIFVVPFVLAWLYFTFGSAVQDYRRALASAAAAAAMLGFSVYAYKAAQLVAPAYLAMMLAFVFHQQRDRLGPQRARMIGVVAVAAFSIAVLPYALASREHPVRYRNFLRVYSIFDPSLSLLQNLRDVARYDSLADRISSYFESFNPRLMFFKGEGAWSDSTRTTGMFLLPAVIPIGVGVYASVVRPSAARGFVLAGFLASPIPSFVLNEAVARRMITVLPFATLLAVEGFRELRRRRFGTVAVAGVATAMGLHFALFYRDYLLRYPLNSFMAWELNQAEAFRHLANEDIARGRRDKAMVLIENPYAPDYAKLYLRKYGAVDLEQRITFLSLKPGPLEAVPDGPAIVVRQLFGGELPTEVCSSEWRIVAVVHEVVGNPSFVVCALK